ncbi:VCBS repeat-containing protein [Streptosporangium fragile]
MSVKSIMRSAALLALVTVLTFPAGQAQAASPENFDFNGDGYNDLAVGVPAARDYSGAGNSGLVTVLYGGPGGLSGHLIRSPERCLSGWDPEGNPYPCTSWGRSLAAADIDADGRTDLVFSGERDVEVDSWKSGEGTPIKRYIDTPTGKRGLRAGQFDDRPGADIVTSWLDGAQNKLAGWYDGADPVAHLLGDGTAQVKETDAGDVDGDGKQELAVIATKWVGGAQQAFLWLVDDPGQAPLKISELGSPTMCTASSPNPLGCPKPESNVAMGDVNADGRLDLVLATPSTATVQIWYGSASGLSRAPNRALKDLTWLWRLPDSGSLLAVGDVTGDGAAEIALGAPTATVHGKAGVGAVALIPGSPAGPVVSDVRFVSEDGIGPVVDGTPAPPVADPLSGQGKAGDRFGEAVTIIDVTGDGKGELIVGVPGKNNANGMVAVLRGSGTGVSPTGAQVIDLGQFGIPSGLNRYGAVLLR